MRINLLPEEVKSCIASGEVIDGAAECIKELVENSLDAGATRIEVEVVKGGKRYIGVRDNGIGIPSDDIRKAILSGATSKIKSLEDLQVLKTYGFRGEALHAIASVSRMVIRSRFYQEEVGKEIRVEGGRVISERMVGMPVGTYVEVFDLFYNLPVRKLFMPKEDTERRKVQAILRALLLANPGVYFHLKSDGKDLIIVKSANSLEERVEDFFGSRFEHLKASRAPLCVDLYLSNEKGKDVYLFVNRRPVQNKKLTEFLKRSVGERSTCLCYLEIPSHMLDVNVHPKKTEVKILKEAKIRELILEALGSRHGVHPSVLLQNRVNYQTKPELIGIIENTIIVAKYGDYLYFFDQHLLSERYHFEKELMEASRACRESHRAGDAIDRKTAEMLLESWMDFENKEVCPHGRPIYHRVYLGEIYKRLGRSY